MNSISFNTIELPEEGSYFEVRLEQDFSKHTNMNVRMNIPPSQPVGKTLVQLQAELWQAVADDAQRLAQSLRQLAENQTTQKS